ncbi:MAG TPA: response regulator [Ramlibacter sp.]|nr:response regulator [Ramlibacter sp.]
MKVSLRPRTLNQALGWLLVGVLAPLLIGSFALLGFQAWQERQLSQTRLSAVSQTLLQAVEGELERSRAQLEVLAASPTVDEGDWQKMRTFAGEITRSLPGSLIVLVNADGQVLFNTVVPWGDPLPNLWKLGAQSREVLWQGRSLPLSSGNLSRQAFEQARPVYSDLYYGVQIHRPAMAVSIPVVREGRSRYALIMSYPPALLQEMFSASLDAPGIRAVLVDRRGVVVAANDLAPSKLGDKVQSPVGLGETPARGNYRITSRDGTELEGAYAVSKLNGFVVRVSQPAAPRFVPTRSSSLAWLGMLVAAMLASVVLASLVSRRLAQPLRRLGEDVLAGRPPSLDRPAGIAEIDLLAKALHDGVQAERERAEEQARRLVAENRESMLRQADKHKDEFLATLAHELRNPLAPIRTAVEVIRRRELQDAIVEQARLSIERQVLHLSRLVDDLLDVSRVTLGRIQLREETVGLGAVAVSACEAVRAAAEAAGVSLHCEVPDPAPAVRGDATRLAQCLLNLLNNAVKFTPPGGQVGLRTWQEGSTAIVEVTDTGVGIAGENLSRIFDLFVQERYSGHHGNTGLGIGLFLTRKIIDLHGGTITADSAGTDQGSTFRIALPAVAQALPPPAAATGSPPPASARPARAVLVVDDNTDAADTLSTLLSMSGFVAHTAADGASALEKIRSLRPDLVLLDIGLPDMDGYAVCRRVREDPAIQHTLLIALTGWGQKSDLEAAQGAGFDGHLTKPVAPQHLLEVLEQHLSGASA